MYFSRIDFIKQRHQHERVKYHGEVLRWLELGCVFGYAVVHVEQCRTLIFNFLLALKFSIKFGLIFKQLKFNISI